MFVPIFVEIPELYAELVITCLVMLYLIYIPRGSRVEAILCHPVSIHIGVRSFSLYVWHWPIVSFLNYMYVDGIPTPVTYIALVFCFALSEVTFRLLENPFRYKLGISYSVMLVVTTCGVMLTVNSLSSVRVGSSLMNNIAAQIQSNFRCGIGEFVPFGTSRACILVPMAESNNIAILGNSHAQMYADAILNKLKLDDRGVILVPLNSCMPTVSLNISQTCLDQAKSILKL